MPDKVNVAIATSGKNTGRRSALDALAKRGVLVCVEHGEGLNGSNSADRIAPERVSHGADDGQDR
jgi:threonine 3-dehydrogenase